MPAGNPDFEGWDAVDKKMDNTYLDLYRSKRRSYQSLCKEVRRIIESSFEQMNLKCQSIDSRTKSIESFKRKVEKVTETGRPKYSDPMSDITDLAGVRVIVYTIDDIKLVTEFIDESFEVVEKRDVGEERIEKGQFGYQSIHYLITFPEERLRLPEASHFANMICEIQVRTVLQHAWAEMEHDIQYKGSENIPKSIKRKFLSLAGLLEIADREFSAIQREDKKLKEGVLTELQKDLTRDAVTRPSGASGRKNSTVPSEDQLESGVQVRDLLVDGKYQDAINVYTTKIKIEPTSYTLYLGRARAYFLLGETNLALEDLNQAERYKSDDPFVKKLRSEIADGHVSIPQKTRTNEANDMDRRGHEALISGKPEEAFILYSDAQSMGASRPFTTFNMALAGAVAGDITGAELLLNQLKIHPGTPMEINIAALRAILFALRGSDQFGGKLAELRDLVVNKGDFRLEMSPLYRLKKIDQKKFWNDKVKEINEVLDILALQS